MKEDKMKDILNKQKTTGRAGQKKGAFDTEFRSDSM